MIERDMFTNSWSQVYASLNLHQRFELSPTHRIWMNLTSTTVLKVKLHLFGASSQVLGVPSSGALAGSANEGGGGGSVRRGGRGAARCGSGVKDRRGLEEAFWKNGRKL